MLVLKKENLEKKNESIVIFKIINLGVKSTKPYYFSDAGGCSDGGTFCAAPLALESQCGTEERNPRKHNTPISRIGGGGVASFRCRILQSGHYLGSGHALGDRWHAKESLLEKWLNSNLPRMLKLAHSGR